MTFKSIKFNESEIMKSFEKVAYENGLIKPEPVVKSASKNTSKYEPTNNLMENIIKLCSGLREIGATAQADEIENNFLMFKAAKPKEYGGEVANMMQVGREKSPTYGDSVYGLIENIFEEHSKLLEIINKTPSGKLTNSSSILNAVKLAFSENIKVAVNITNEHRVKSGLDTLKEVSLLLTKFKSILVQTPKADRGDIEDLTAEADNILGKISSVNKDILNLQYVLNLQAELTELRDNTIDLRDSWWEAAFRPIGFKDYEQYMNSALAVLTETFGRVGDVYDVLSGARDEWLRSYYNTSETSENKTNTSNNPTESGTLDYFKYKLKTTIDTITMWHDTIALNPSYDDEDKKYALKIVNHLYQNVSKIQDYINKHSNDAGVEVADKALNALILSDEYVVIEDKWV